MNAKRLIVMLALTGLIPGLVTAKETPPEGGIPKDFSLPAKKTFSLDNGLDVTLVQYGEIPKVNISLVIRTGNIDEAEGQTWLADLTGEYLKEGTSTRTGKQIAREAAEIGGGVEVNIGADQTSVSGVSLSEFAPQLTELLADIVRNPAFPESELDRLKNNQLRQLSVQLSQPQPQAQARFRELMYPDHPYGRLFPSESDIQGFGIENVQAFYDGNYGAVKSHLYVVGLFDEKAVEKAIRSSLNDWREGDPFSEKVPTPVTARLVHLIDRPGSPQSTIMMGGPVVNPTNPDYVAMIVMNSLLGGSFGSRIISNVREDKGYSYSPVSSLSSRYRDTYWAENADVTTEHTGASLKEFFYEINRMQSETPTTEELEAIQNYQAGIFVLQNSSRGGIIGQLSFLDLHGLDESYLTNFVETVYSLTPEDLQRVAADYLNDEEMTIVIVGDVKKIRSQVAPYGNVVF